MQHGSEDREKDREGRAAQAFAARPQAPNEIRRQVSPGHPRRRGQIGRAVAGAEIESQIGTLKTIRPERAPRHHFRPGKPLRFGRDMVLELEAQGRRRGPRIEVRQFGHEHADGPEIRNDVMEQKIEALALALLPQRDAQQRPPLDVERPLIEPRRDRDRHPIQHALARPVRAFNEDGAEGRMTRHDPVNRHLQALAIDMALKAERCRHGDQTRRIGNQLAQGPVPELLARQGQEVVLQRSAGRDRFDGRHVSDRLQHDLQGRRTIFRQPGAQLAGRLRIHQQGRGHRFA